MHFRRPLSMRVKTPRMKRSEMWPWCFWMNSCRVRPVFVFHDHIHGVVGAKKLSTRITLGCDRRARARPSSKKHFMP